MKRDDYTETVLGNSNLNETADSSCNSILQKNIYIAAEYENKVAQASVGYTATQYTLLQLAFNYFNVQLFDGILPDVLITLQRRRGARGYFAKNKFLHTRSQKRVHEISINPDTFYERSIKGILSTIVHEQAHLWQYVFGKKYPKGGYHNTEWADKMESIGLRPMAVGARMGHRTGPRCTHTIIPEGPFEWAYEEFVMCHSPLPFAGNSTVLDLPDSDGPVTQSKRAKHKFTYKCPGCGQVAWAKPKALLMCGKCYEDLQTEDE